MRSEPVEPPTLPGHATRTWTTPPINIKSGKGNSISRKKQATSSLTTEVRLSLLTRASSGPVPRNKYYPPVAPHPVHSRNSRRSSGKLPDLMDDSSSPSFSSRHKRADDPAPPRARITNPAEAASGGDAAASRLNAGIPTGHQRAASQPLSREDIARAIAQRYPEQKDQEKVARFLQSQQIALKESTKRPTLQKKGTSSKSLVQRFPEPREREKVAKFLQSQQDALDWAAVMAPLPSQKQEKEEPEKQPTLEDGSTKSLTDQEQGGQEKIGRSLQPQKDALKGTDSVKKGSPLQQEKERPSKKELTREDVAKSLARRYPDQKDREKIVRFLQSQQDALNGADTVKKGPPPQNENDHPKKKELTREDVAKSLADRYPDQRDREKIVRFLQSQQDALNGVDSKSPPPPQGEEVVSKKKELSREDVAKSLAERYPDQKDREKIVRFLQSQQDAMNSVDMKCPPPPQEEATKKKELTREEVAKSLVERYTDPKDREKIVRFLQSQKDAMNGVGAKCPPPPPPPRPQSDQHPKKEPTRPDVAMSFAERYSGQKDGEKIVPFFHPQQDVLLNPKRLPRTTSSSSLRSPESVSHESVCQPIIPRRVVTCQCCFGEIDTGKPFRCAAGKHDFCMDCIKRYVEAWVYGEPYRLRDVPSEEGEGASFKALPCLSYECAGGFLTHDTVQRANKENVWESYQEKIFHIMSLADRKMHAAAFIDKGEDEDEVAESDGAAKGSGRRGSVHAVEEAMTEAKLRRCPDCHSPFLKESGYCNKIRCPNCRVAICYICRQRVPSKGYDHFCVHSYDECIQNCGKCVLWTNTDDQVDQDRLRFVATNEANRLWGESLLDGSDENMDVEVVDVERLLQEPGAAKKSTHVPDGADSALGEGNMESSSAGRWQQPGAKAPGAGRKWMQRFEL